jgi:hypothetical protein
LHGGDDFETIIYLSQKDEAGIRKNGGALEIDHDGTVKIRTEYLFLAFTTNEPLGAPRFAIKSFLY